MPKPRPGALVFEAELARLAADAVEAAGVTRAAAAERIGANPSAVTRALDVERYPTKGHGVRRAILRTYAELDVEGPLFRLVRAEPEPEQADA